MSQKTARETGECTDDGTNDPVETRIGVPPIPFPMIFLNWIDPPIGFNTSAIDPNHPFYRVRIMNVGQSGGSNSFEVPFAELVQWNPLATSPSIWQFQMIGVPPDPTALEYYMTMTVVQPLPGLQQVRSRIFTAPQLNHTVPQFVSSADLVLGNPSFIRVDGIVNASNYTVAVYYKHVIITNANIDPNGPRDLFLQQPW